ncbi:MAG: hypothetical protein V9G98_14540 [Candidatus Competibacter sp.]
MTAATGSTVGGRVVKINTHSASAKVGGRIWRPSFFARARARRRASAAWAGGSRRA